MNSAKGVYAVHKERQEIIGWLVRWSDKLEFIADKHGKRLGSYESDTGVTRDAQGKIVGHGGNQSLRLLS